MDRRKAPRTGTGKDLAVGAQALGGKRRLQRFGAACVLGSTPIVALAWAGCSDDNKSSGAPVVDPGGTYGAEVTVNVIGRGRIKSETPGIDCPSTCLTKYIFPSNTADGAAGGLKLTAVPTEGAKFLGWTFETDVVGSRGRGPDECNPINRAAVSGQGSGTDPTITLPFGETSGTAPAGHEAQCAGYLKVPQAYKVTAKFDTDLADAGVDGGGGTVAFTAAAGTISARKLGMASSYLIWQTVSSANYNGIAGGSASSLTNQTPIEVLAPTETMSAFRVSPYGVAWQTASGVSLLNSPFGTPETMGGSAPSCTALYVDVFSDVYCRTSTSIVVWSFPYTSPSTLFSGVASGSDLEVDSSYIYINTATSILRYPKTGEAGAGTAIVSGRVAPAGLYVTSFDAFWTESGLLYTSSNLPLSSGSNTGTPSNAGGQPFFLGADPSSSSYVFAATSTAIYRASLTSSAFKSGLAGVTGVAASSSYVYWTTTDGRVLSASRTEAAQL